jgi:hypothetical protein
MIALALAALLAGGESTRVALLVGDDGGFSGEQSLRYTGDDVDRVAAVLRELGGFAPGDVHVLKGKTGAEILDAVDVLARASPASMFVFYYSGHADAGALHPAGTLLPIDLLLHRLRAVGADLRLTIFDACQSGAAARPKGSVPAAPFEVRLEDDAAAGDILISSSAADEESFENEHGGIFTLHWTAGLRGAADANGDGRVTLGEAYEYAYAQTLRSTLAAGSGPQHARFRYALSGRSDPVLTWLAGGSLLTLQSQSEGVYAVFDSRERSVVAELPSRPGIAQRLALSPGGYVVRQRTTRSLRVARVQLERGDDRVLSDYQMQEVPLLQLSRKGAFGDARLAVRGGQLASGLGPRGSFLATAGVEWDEPRWAQVADLALSAGEEDHLGLTTHDLFVQASGALLYTARMGTGALRLGPVAGLAFLRQGSGGAGDRSGFGLSAGLRLLGEVRLTQRLGVEAMLDARAMGVRMAGRSAGVGLFGWGAYGVGLTMAL